MTANLCSYPSCGRAATHASGRCIYHTSWKNGFDPHKVPVTPFPTLRRYDARPAEKYPV